MQGHIRNTYVYFITLPDRLYPFASEIEGQWVRGQASYRHALEHALQTYGPGRLGFKLMVYRETFHFLGSVVFIVAATLLSKSLFGSDIALYVLLGAAIIALSIQEFHLHPKRYGQLTYKGMTDWATWVFPMMLYIFLFLN